MLAPAVRFDFWKMVRSAGIAPASPDWHSGILLLDDDREWAARDASLHTRAAYDKKEQTPLPTRNLSSHPLENFTAVLSVFQAHLPVHDIASHAKPLDWKSQGEESDNTDPVASRSEDRLA